MHAGASEAGLLKLKCNMVKTKVSVTKSPFFLTVYHELKIKSLYFSEDNSSGM